MGDDFTQGAWRQKELLCGVEGNIQVGLGKLEFGQVQNGIGIIEFVDGVDIGVHVATYAVGFDEGENGEFLADVFPVDGSTGRLRQRSVVFCNGAISVGGGIIEPEEEILPALIYGFGLGEKLLVQVFDVPGVCVGKMRKVAHGID